MKRLQVDQAGATAGAAALVAALSAILSVVAPLAGLSRLPFGSNRWYVAVVGLAAMTIALVCLALFVAPLFRAAPLLSHYVALDPSRSADLNEALQEAQLLKTAETVADLNSRVDTAYTTVDDPGADSDVRKQAGRTLDRVPPVLDYAARWERDRQWRKLRFAIIPAAVVAAAGGVSFAWATAVPAPVSTPIPVTVVFTDEGWKQLTCAPAPTPSPLTGVAVEGYLTEPVVVLPAQGTCTGPQQFEVTEDRGWAIPNVATPSPQPRSSPSTSSEPSSSPSIGVTPS